MQASSVKIAWKVMLALGIYTAVLGLLWIFPTETAAVAPAFNSFTTQSWSDFLTSSPKPAELLIIVNKALGSLAFVIALFTILVAWKSYRKAEKWSWYTFLITGTLTWGTSLAYNLALGYFVRLIAPIVGSILFVIGIALPAKAILGKKVAGK
ncbi:MAG: hypothetical protein ACE5K3_00195 [bacterium]